MFLLLLLLSAVPAISAPLRTLTFQERVDAQEAIERVYYGYQVDAERSFEEAYPRGILEEEVRGYLRKSAALEAFWGTPVTAAALDRELERVAARTRLPERLREIYDALGNDPVLVRESFARPLLVDRLIRNFYSRDERIHGRDRADADALRASLELGQPPRGHQAVRTEIVRGRNMGSESAASRRIGRDDLRPAHLGSEDWERRRALSPERPGEVGPVVEGRDGFSVEVLLSASADRFRIATYHVPKRAWQDWWEETAEAYDADTVEPVASSKPLPQPSKQMAGATMTEGGGCIPDDNWNNGSLDDIPEPRFNHSTVWTGSVMLVWGGFGLAPYLLSGGTYDPLTDVWTPISTLNAPSARHLHSTVWTGTLMMVWGGDGASDEVNDGGRYDPASDTWTPITTVGAPIARKAHSGVWTGTEMIIWGGSAGTISTITGGRYNPTTDSWTPTAIDVNTPAGREDHSAVWSGTEMVIWGGASANALKNGAKYNPVTDAWGPMNNSGSPTARFDHTTLWTGSEMIVWGGFAFPDALNTGGAYDPVADDWFLMTTLNAPSARRNHAAIWTGSHMIVWGGSAGTIQETGSRWERATNSWNPTTQLNAPTARQLHSAVWTGTEMILWTGVSGSDLTTSGARYNPTLNAWTPTSQETGQPARKDHTAIWTGTEMIVWGGFGNGAPDYRNDGARYDPVTDQWTLTTLTNAPAGRSNHKGFWTGSLMVVWGGFDGFNDLSSGARYDPIGDTWTPTASLNAPSTRTGSGATWTGTEMIVWGGATGPSFLADGARYNPAGDTWSPMSSVGAPSGRFLHSMVWSGSEVLLWGGDTQLGLVDDGFRYDPSADTWTAMSQSGAPSPRTRHQIAWTGTEMIVWGGRDVTDLLTDGARYNPSLDAWQSMSVFNAPTGRIRSASVWSGTEMVVWGGFDETAFPYLDSGARYDPGTDTWVPTTIASAPSPRNEHTAVWFNGIMVVWGGSDGSVLNTGGRYVVGTLADSDIDGVADLCDNCPAIGNAGQEDGDLDGIGNVCDNCSVIFNSGQEDGDVDGVGNVCDNCPVVFNDDQADGDSDTFGDLCDCAPGDGGSFAIPGEATNIVFLDNTTYAWDSTAPGAGSGTLHQGLRGVASELPVGAGGSEACLGSAAVTQATDNDVPASGAAFWYLVRGTNTCGPGTYGASSASVERLSAICP